MQYPPHVLQRFNLRQTYSLIPILGLTLTLAVSIAPVSRAQDSQAPDTQAQNTDVTETIEAAPESNLPGETTPEATAEPEPVELDTRPQLPLPIPTDSANTEIEQLSQQVIDQYGQGDLAGAIASVEQLAAIYEEQQQYRLVGDAWNSLGLLQEQQENFEAAIAAYEQAISAYGQLATEQPNIAKSSEARTLNNLGAAFAAAGNFEDAIAFLERSLIVFRELNAPVDEVVTLNNMAGTYIAMNQVPAAIAALESALQIEQTLQRPQRLLSALDQLSYLYLQSGAVPETLDVLQQALTLVEGADEAASRAIIQGRIGEIYTLTGDLDSAVTWYEQAVQTSQTLTDDSSIELSLLEQLGRTYTLSEEIDQALQTYDTALTLAQSGSNALDRGAILVRIADLHFRQGNLLQAEQSYNTALGLVENATNLLVEGEVLRGLGEVAIAQQDFSKAQDLLQKALARQQAADNSPTDIRKLQATGLTLRRLGDLKRQQGQYREALTHYEDALQQLEAGRDVWGQLETLNSVGLTLLFQEDYETALNPLLDAIDGWELLTIQTQSFPEPLAEAHQFLQIALVGMGQPELALQSAEQLRSLPNRFSQILEGKTPAPPLNIDQIKAMAANQNADILYYSISSSPVAGASEVQPELWAWLVKPTGEVELARTNLLEQGLATPADLSRLIQNSLNPQLEQSQARQILDSLLIQPIAEFLNPEAAETLLVSLPAILEEAQLESVILGNTTLGDRYEVKRVPFLQSPPSIANP
ncbi:MAG: tetratricopeptide repeat protein [Cyanobacteria bacterium P01_H01_bin.121]